jgi:pimeloyl-ACP methyl ester carboxylesterase
MRQNGNAYEEGLGDAWAPIWQYWSNPTPPLLAIWGKNDPFFIPPGAEAYPRDTPNATVGFLDRLLCAGDPP